MSISTMWLARRSPQAHQENWGAELGERLHGLCLRWARYGHRQSLRDLADNPHLLADIGVTREEALQEAGKFFFE
jgi:uncharacterized protein YjiS (DUF1127 family)